MRKPGTIQHDSSSSAAAAAADTAASDSNPIPEMASGEIF